MTIELDDDVPVVLGRPLASGRPDPRSELVGAIDRAFAAPIRRARTSPLYALALVIVGSLALALPFIYLAIAAALGLAGVVVLVAGIPEVRGYFSAVLVGAAGLGPILASLTLFAPLLQRRPRPRDERPIIVTRVSEPVLFHLLDRCAAALDVRIPDEVHLTCDANAAVARTPGGGLALILGLPLVASLSVRQLAGVIAHELGHVRQGFGRRFLVFVVASYAWFDGAVEGARDPVSSGNGFIDLVRAVSLFVGLALLRVCLALSEALIVALAREMELDADRAEAAVAGAETFASTSENVCAAADVLFATTLRARLQSHALPENLPRWCALHVSLMSRPERRRAARRLTRDAAGVPHPPHDDRVANARRTGLPGVALPDDVTGDALFRSFDAYATRATREALFDLAPRARLVPNDSVLAQGPR